MTSNSHSIFLLLTSCFNPLDLYFHGQNININNAINNNVEETCLAHISFDSNTEVTESDI